MRSRFLFFFILLGLPAAPLQASDFTIFAGFNPTGSLPTTGTRIDFENGGIFGVRYEKDYAILGFENTLAYMNQVAVAEGFGGGSGYLYTVNVVLNIPLDKAIPFVTLGLGFIHKNGSEFPDIGTSFLTNFGIGVKFRELAGPAGVRFDYRRFNIRNVEDESLKTNELSAGLLFSF